MQLEDGCPQPGVRVGVLRALRHRNTTTFGQEFQRFIKADPVDLLDEFENIAPDTASEAFIELMISVNAKRRCLFGVEGT